MKNKIQFTEKYSPRIISDFVGNTSEIKRAFNIVKRFRTDPNDADYRGMIIIGPTGVGKTRLAEFIAESRGMVPIVLTASATRKKNEIENFEILYKSNMSHLYKSNHPMINRILQKSNRKYLKNRPIGKVLIVDEVESITKGERGLLSPLIKILKEGPTNPDTFIIITLDVEKVKKFATLKRWCCEIKLKTPSISETLKLVERVCRGEDWKLSKAVKQSFARNCQGDFRRLMMELQQYYDCMTTKQIQSKTAADIDKYFESKQLRLRDTSVVGILEMVIDEIVDKCELPKIFSLVELEGYTIPIYLFETYPHIVNTPKQKDVDRIYNDELIFETHKEVLLLDSIADASECISRGDVMYNQLKKTSPGIFGEEHNADPDVNFSDFYRSCAVIEPILCLKYVIPKKYEINVKNYKRFYSVKAIIESHRKVHNRMNAISKFWYERHRDEWMFLRSRLFRLLANECDWNECMNMLVQNDLPIRVLDELVKIRGHVTDPIAIEGEKLYKGVFRTKFKRKFEEVKPKPVGLKFADEKPKKPKIIFFPNFSNK